MPAARRVLAAVAEGRLKTPEFVTRDVTWTSEIGIDPASPLYQTLSAPSVPTWAGILAAQLERSLARFYPQTMQHDPLTLTAALRLPFVDFDEIAVTIDDNGMLTEQDGGTRLSGAEGRQAAIWKANASDTAGRTARCDRTGRTVRRPVVPGR